MVCIIGEWWEIFTAAKQNERQLLTVLPLPLPSPPCFQSGSRSPPGGTCVKRYKKLMKLCLVAGFNGR